MATVDVKGLSHFYHTRSVSICRWLSIVIMSQQSLGWKWLPVSLVL